MARVMMTDDDGFLTDNGLRWLGMMVLVAGLAIVSYMGQHDTSHARPTPPPVVTVATTTSTSSTTTTTSSTTVTPSTTTTATSSPPTTAAAVHLDATEAWLVSSTVYCEHGITFSGEHTRPGVVSVSYADWPRLKGTRWTVTAGPAIVRGRTFTVADKGPAARFDMWMGDHPDCRTWGRNVYGRQPITVTPA